MIAAGIVFVWEYLRPLPSREALDDGYGKRLQFGSVLQVRLPPEDAQKIR